MYVYAYVYVYKLKIPHQCWEQLVCKPTWLMDVHGHFWLTNLGVQGWLIWDLLSLDLAAWRLESYSHLK